MAKPQGDFDLGCYVVMWKSEYVAKKLIQPLQPFFDNPALADPAYDMKDVVPIYLENLGLVGGPKGYLAGPGAKLYGMPYGAETSVLAYRRDIFAKHNLKPPETYDDFTKLLRVIKDKEGIGALASRGQAGHQCVHAWLLSRQHRPRTPRPPRHRSFASVWPGWPWPAAARAARSAGFGRAAGA